MDNEANRIINRESFIDFVNQEFNNTVAHATIEEMAKFTFGSVDEALEEYMKNMF